MKKNVLFFISLLIFSACSTSLITKTEYVRVAGTHFEYKGEPYYFAGTNFWYGCYLGRDGQNGDRERLKRELDYLKELGITNLRILAASEKSYIQGSLEPAVQNEPGNFNENLLDGLDYLLYEMRKREMFAVVFLSNYWEWSGGFAVYNRWAGDSNYVDPHNPEQGWTKFMNYSAKFYTNDKANEYYRNFILKIVTRKNKYTGDYYYNDPTIMAWQLANEPRPGWGEEGFRNANNFYKWIDETVAFIRSIDPNHLITTGNEGLGGCLDADTIFINAHKSPNIDYATFHLWAKNWGWFDAKKIEETYPSTEKKAIDYFNTHMILARRLNKPITLEEFGMPRDNEEYKSGSPVTARDRYFLKIFDLVSDSAEAGAPIAGTNFWAWGGEGKNVDDDYLWEKGEPFTGDPPQEPQGLNSVFISDKSTLEIISKHAADMNRLRNLKYFVRNLND